MRRCDERTCGWRSNIREDKGGAKWERGRGSSPRTERQDEREKGDQRGFSYIEVTLLLASFALGFAALGTLSPVIGDRNNAAFELAAATLIGQSEMEKLKQVGYGELVDTGEIEGVMGPLDVHGEPAASGKYTLTWDIRQDEPEVGTKLLLVEVTWLSDSLKEKRVTFRTAVYDAT